MSIETTPTTKAKKAPAKRTPAAKQTKRFEREPVVDEMRALVDELRREREALEQARVAAAPERAPVQLPQRAPVDLGPWPERIMAGGLAFFTLLILLIALS